MIDQQGKPCDALAPDEVAQAFADGGSGVSRLEPIRPRIDTAALSGAGATPRLNSLTQNRLLGGAKPASPIVRPLPGIATKPATGAYRR